MTQNEPKNQKQSNLTHNQQQCFKTNFSLPCQQSDRFFYNSFNKEKGFMYLGISKTNFPF